MARINTYPIDTDIVGSDKWIGSDSQQLYATKNFTVNGVMEFINNYNKVDSTSLRYEYLDYTSEVGRVTGTISFLTNQAASVAFSTVTTFKISEFQLERISDSLGAFYSSPLTGSVIMISQCSAISNWGAFRWTGATADVLNPGFYDITLEYLIGPGNFVDLEDYFISILTYDSNASNDKNYVYNQVAASAQWQVTHSLNKYCSVEVVNDNGIVVYPSIDYLSLNTVTIGFSTAQSGSAYFN